LIENIYLGKLYQSNINWNNSNLSMKRRGIKPDLKAIWNFLFQKQKLNK